MGFEWRTCRLEELAAPSNGSIAIGPFGSRLKADSYVDEGVGVIRGTNLSGRTLSGEFVFITSEKASELGSANLQPGDLVFPHRGSIGEVGIVPADGARYALSTSLMKISLDQNRVMPEFLYYFFKSTAGRSELLRNASQVGTPGIATPLKSLRECRVPCPSRALQDQAVGILRGIDDRIDNLKSVNVSLEAIAQALFKSWFVDFDPVRAKAEGREPEGMDGATAALFPSKFEDSELGPIPRGWEAGQLADLMQLRYGKALRAADRNEGEVPVYGSGGVTGFHDKPLVAGPTVIVGRKGTVGSIYWESMPCHPIDTAFYVEPKESLHYSYHALQRAGLDRLNTDAAVPGLNRNNAYRQPVVIPPADVVEMWDGLSSNLRSRMDAAKAQAATLRTLRETLLPRLISGRLRLPEAEAILKEATA